MKKIIILSIIIIAIAAIIALYFLLDEEHLELNPEARSKLPGSFIRLSEGYTHYEIDGPKSGKKVVLIHGFTMPYFVWDTVFNHLKISGFRVLRYDLYGRGYSDRPDVDYTIDLFDKQIVDLLNALKWNDKVDIIGFSMGGAITINYALEHSKRVRKIGLISPFTSSRDLPFVTNFVKIPVLGEYLMATLGKWFLLQSLQNNFDESPKIDEITKNFKLQLPYIGYKSAILSSLRNILSKDYSDSYDFVGLQRCPVLLIMSKKDKLIPFENNEKIIAAIPHAEFITLENSSHIPMLDVEYKKVNDKIVQFLRRKK